MDDPLGNKKLCFLLIGNSIFESLNHIEINLKPRFLIKSGYYIVPSPSTALQYPFGMKAARHL